MSQVPEVVKETEGALPEVCLFVLDWIGSVEDLPGGLPSNDAHHGADHQLTLVKTLWSLTGQ